MNKTTLKQQPPSLPSLGVKGASLDKEGNLPRPGDDLASFKKDRSILYYLLARKIHKKKSPQLEKQGRARVRVEMKRRERSEGG